MARGDYPEYVRFTMTRTHLLLFLGIGLLYGLFQYGRHCYIEHLTNQQYEGILLQKERNYAWRHDLGNRARLSYEYFWQVATFDGEVHWVEIYNAEEFQMAQAGDTIRKVQGVRWPWLMTQQARERRGLVYSPALYDTYHPLDF